MILADRIRSFVLEKKIIPARERNQRIITIKAGDIHSEMGLKNQMPVVFGTLDAEKFLAFAGVNLTERSGTRQGSSAIWVFALE